MSQIYKHHTSQAIGGPVPLSFHINKCKGRVAEQTGGAIAFNPNSIPTAHISEARLRRILFHNGHREIVEDMFDAPEDYHFRQNNNLETGYLRLNDNVIELRHHLHTVLPLLMQNGVRISYEDIPIPAPRPQSDNDSDGDEQMGRGFFSGLSLPKKSPEMALVERFNKKQKRNHDEPGIYNGARLLGKAFTTVKNAGEWFPKN